MNLSFFFHFGQYLMFLRSMLYKPQKWKVFINCIFDEMNKIGIGSLPIVAITSLFIGAVTTVQTAYQLVSGLIAKSVIGTIVSDSTMLELGPTITCLVLSGKVGAHISSEIGNMRISEQIDALEVMGINAPGYLALPKIIAGIIMIPMLNIIAITLSIWGGYIAGELSGILTHEQFITGAKESFKGFTLLFSMIKAFTFAFIITSVSSYQGYYTKGGALEVGESSTKAVVYSSVLILFFDYLLAELLL
jgi:phospholipid/cholesterol/gamma-HCH transport system permease protein